MDKLTVISGTLFMAADVFAIVSLAMPDWIITDVGGKYVNVKLSQGHLHIKVVIYNNTFLHILQVILGLG